MSLLNLSIFLSLNVQALGTAEGAEKISVSAEQEEEARPADVRRQRQIFDRTPLDERELTSFDPASSQPDVKHTKQWLS